MWLMLQQEQPEDFVIATGEQHSVREFVAAVARELGMNLRWKGAGTNEEAIDTQTGARVVAVDPRYFRPAEVDTLLGDATKAREKLGWKPRTSFTELVTEMVHEELRLAKYEAVCKQEGLRVLSHYE
jgi:GDPmannose 4,6-dehydratase